MVGNRRKLSPWLEAERHPWSVRELGQPPVMGRVCQNHVGRGCGNSGPSPACAIAAGINGSVSPGIMIIVVAPHHHDDNVGTGAGAVVKVGAETESRATEESLSES